MIYNKHKLYITMIIILGIHNKILKIRNLNNRNFNLAFNKIIWNNFTFEQ